MPRCNTPSTAAAIGISMPSRAANCTSAAAVARLSARLGIEMPITAAVDGVLHRGMAIDLMVERLLSRPYRSE